jgi:hypothetical protein
VTTSTAAGGDYVQGLAPDTYNVTASAYGYQPQNVNDVLVLTNTTTVQNFSLTPQATGLLSGTVKDKISNAPLSATIVVEGTPAETTTNPADGSYSLELPIGLYTISAMAAGHRISQAVNINISASQTTVQHFLLDPAPSILIVDSGAWYQESQVGYYQQALDDLLYPYDIWQIRDPFGDPGDIPPAAVLTGYDVVIWSAPFDSPGYIGADDELVTFLTNGGRLLLSGQDVAFFDDYWFPSPYFASVLKASFVKDNADSNTLAGSTGEAFEGLSLSIAGGDGADNQISPDVISNLDTDAAGSLLSYDNDQLGALRVDRCLPYRAMVLAFGFEAINSQPDRAQVMDNAMDWLTKSPDPTGVELTPLQETRVGSFGTTISQSVRLRNIGATGDVFTLTVSGGVPYDWPVSGIPPTVALDTCAAQDINGLVQIPAARNWHISDTFTVTARSGSNPAVFETVVRSTKTPAPVLLVDDDRWYSYAEEFKSALAANNIPYDYWFVPKDEISPEPASPPLDTLQLYPMTVWYSAYDWLQPLTPAEESRLASYLDGGGRLFYSGQDFLYRHLLNHGDYNEFARDYLGIQAHTEDFTSTLTVGQPGNPVGAYMGPYNLTFPPGHQNFTDALTPTSTAKIATRGQAGQPNGLTHAGLGPGGKPWHTVFLAYGPELLQPTERARMLQRTVGWLSWLGSSTVEATATSVANGSLITFTTNIENSGWDQISTAHLTATFPVYLVPVSASPGVSLESGAFIWTGALAASENKSLTYTAQIAGPPPAGTTISQTSWLAYPEHGILFDRIATLEATPALETSSMTVSPSHDVEQNDVLSYTITFRAVISGAGQGLIKNVAQVYDGTNGPIGLSAEASFKALPYFLPIIVK